MNFIPNTRASLIVRLGRADDAAAWQQFVELYQPVVYRLARRSGLAHDDAVDVTQEVLARVAGAVERWDPDPALGSFRGWLARITRNMVISFLRRQRRRPLTSDDTSIRRKVDEQPDWREEADANSQFDIELERELFRHAARRIEGQFQASTWQAFWRTAVLNESIDDVASALRMTRGAVYVARSRVMARLKTEIQSIVTEE
jgi:RNA polymerase sigma-70 factor (ECF subfamily)